MACVVCAGDELRVLGRRSTFEDLALYAPFVTDVSRFDRDIVRCAGCGMSFVQPMYGAEDFSELYGSAAYSKFQACFAPEVDFRSREGRRLLTAWKNQFRALGIESLREDAFRRSGRATFLDVGCGLGRNLLVFRDLGFEVAGVELNPEEAERSRKLGGFEVHTCDAEEFSRGGRRFDCVLASHVIEHVADPLRFLETLDRLTAPEGLIVLETPLANDHGRPEQRFRDIYHTLFFDHFTLLLVAANSGFRPVAWQNIHFGSRLGGSRNIFVQVALQRCVRSTESASDRNKPMRSAYDALLGDALAWSDRALEPRIPGSWRRAARAGKRSLASSAAARRIWRWFVN